MHLFSLGTIEVTLAASAALAAASTDPAIYLARHQSGDWGEVDESWQQANDLAIQHEEQIDSRYKLSDDIELLVSTAADRSCTRMLLAEEHQRREISTQEGYAVWAESYDKERNPLIAVEEPYVDALVAALPITSALDVGTGTGRHALKLARRGAAVTAIDQSPEMLAVAQQAARNEGLTIDFQLASLDDGLPFESNQFDFLICALTLSHVPNLAQAIQEFYRVLQHGGYLLITDFHPNAIGEGWRTVFFRPGISYYLPTMPHTRADYLETLATTGFTILNVIDVPVRDVPSGYLSDTFIRDNGDKPFCLIVLAQKEPITNEMPA